MAKNSINDKHWILYFCESVALKLLSNKSKYTEFVIFNSLNHNSSVEPLYLLFNWWYKSFDDNLILFCIVNLNSTFISTGLSLSLSYLIKQTQTITNFISTNNKRDTD